MQESAAGFLTSARSYCSASVMRHKLNELHGTKENIFFYVYIRGNLKRIIGSSMFWILNLSTFRLADVRAIYMPSLARKVCSRHTERELQKF